MTTAKQTPRITPDALGQAAECLRTLAHPVRLQMIDLLLQGRFTVGELAEACAVRSNVASEHLRLMERCGLLSKEREGRRIYYCSAHPCLERIIECVQCQFGD